MDVVWNLSSSWKNQGILNIWIDPMGTSSKAKESLGPRFTLVLLLMKETGRTGEGMLEILADGSKLAEISESNRLSKTVGKFDFLTRLHEVPPLSD